MKKQITSFILFLLSLPIIAQGELKGTITDIETGDPIIFGTVALYQNDVLITGFESDLEGHFHIAGLPSGTYDVVVSYTGYSDKRYEDIDIENGSVYNLEVTLCEVQIICIFSSGCISPMIEADNTTQGFKFTSDQMDRMAISW